jgi:hypothetical protein
MLSALRPSLSAVTAVNLGDGLRMSSRQPRLLHGFGQFSLIQALTRRLHRSQECAICESLWGQVSFFRFQKHARGLPRRNGSGGLYRKNEGGLVSNSAARPIACNSSYFSEFGLYYRLSGNRLSK